MDELSSLLRRYEWLCRCWLTNFVTEDHFARLEPGTREAMMSLSDEELQRLATDLPVSPSWPSELRDLVLAARRLAPPASATRDDDEGASRPNGFFFRGLPRTRNMSPKKLHEVLRLAPLVARVAKRCGASTIVDLGSGLGYLSHVLSFHFGLHVVGLEASNGNVAAAHQRAWMVREKLKDPRFRVSEAKAGYAPPSPSGGDADGSSTSAPSTAKCLPHLRNAAAGGGAVSAAAAAAATASAEAAAAAAEAGAAAAACGMPSPLVLHGGGSFSNVAVRLHPTCSIDWLEETLSPAVAQIDAALRNPPGDNGRAGGSAESLAPDSTAANRDASLPEQPPPAKGQSNSHHRFLLVGLHACGDLTPTLLRLAARAVTRSKERGAEPCAPHGETPPRPRCVGVVSVGCCYHKVSEPLPGEKRPNLAVAGAPARLTAACNDDDASQGEVDSEWSNFPMSQHCQRLGVVLGEIALHLSLQAVWRWPVPMTSVSETISRCRQHLFRCVLEVRLQELRGPRCADRARERPNLRACPTHPRPVSRSRP